MGRDAGELRDFLVHEERARELGAVVAGQDAVFDRIWAIVTELGNGERHFNQLQSTYRTLASTWLLATFAGIGYTLSTEKLSLPIDKQLAVVLIAVAGCAGITLLWSLDLLVYHALLEACFITGLGLEEQFRWLPPVRHLMLRTSGGTGVLMRVVWFYLVGEVILFSIAASAFILWLAQGRMGVPLLILGFVAWVVLAGDVLRVMWVQSAGQARRLYGGGPR